jgi:hypothetical protein
MRKLSLFGGLLAAVLMLAGCGAQSGTTQIKYEKGSDPGTLLAPEDGTYALYTANDTTPQVRQRLKKGDKLGFERLPEGKVRAFAGTYEMNLDASTMQAYWKLQEEK